MIQRSDGAMIGDKARIENDIEKLRAEVLRLENQLSEAKENERLLVEYPDLHYNDSSTTLAGLYSSRHTSYTSYS